MASSLDKALLALPYELHYMILDKYKQMYLFPEIRESRNKTFNTIKNKFITILNHSLEDDTYDNINKLLTNIDDLCDVNEYYIFSRLLEKANHYKGLYFTYPAKCIIGFQEYFYSLTYYERQKIRDEVLENSKYYSNERNGNESKGNERNPDTNESFNIRERFSNLLSRKYTHIIDPDELHSGASFGWCMVNLIPIIFGSNEKKIIHWCKMINSHFL